MNNFDEPVKKAETDAEILDALQGVKLTQDEIRRGACGGMGLAFFRAYYEKLPEEVARRLTEIDTEAVGHITRATGLNLSGSLLDRFGEKLASDAAFAQVIRAANVYRGAAGLRSPRAGRLAGGRDMSERARKAGQFAGAVERLAGALAVNEIIRARRFLGAATSDEEREILLGMPLPELLRAAQALTSAVCLRQQTEAAEHMRELEAQQKAAQEPRKGPFVS